MNIVHILPKFDTGGAEKFCVDICNTLADDPKNSVTLLVLGTIDEDEILAKQVQSNVNLIALNKRGKSIKIIFDLIKMLKKLNPDITHTHLRAQAYSALPIIITKVANVHTIHNLAQKEIGPKIRSLYRFLYRNFNFTPVAISKEVLISMQKEYGNNFHQMIDNGAKALTKTELFDSVKQYVDSLRDTPNTKVFVTVGRLTEQKNYLMLIELFEELIDEGEDVKLIIIGSKTNDKEYAQKCIESVKSEDKIQLIGEKSNIGDYVLNCDTFCLSSIYEGMPISILEAMSAGKPTISTPVGGVVDIITDGVNGYLSEDIDKKSYKDTIKRYIKNPDFDSLKIQEIFNQNYSIEKTAKEYKKLYEQTII